MTDLQVYAGIVAAGIAIGGVLAPSIVATHKRLESEVGDMPWWADASAIVGAGLASVTLATACGAILAWRSDALGHDPYIGAVWGFVGGVVGPTLWPSVRRMVVAAVRERMGG